MTPLHTIPPAFEGPAIVELLGHRTLAGFCREVEVCGARVLRIQVPLPDDRTMAHLVPASSLYALTPSTAETVADTNWCQRNEDILYGYNLLSTEEKERRQARLAAMRRAYGLGETPEEDCGNEDVDL